MKIERLTANIGAKISAFDLGKVVMAQREELRALLEGHLVPFFVGQQLDLDQFQNFGAVIGMLKRGVASPGLRGDDDFVIRIEVPPGTRRGGYADRWHCDDPDARLPAVFGLRYLPGQHVCCLGASFRTAPAIGRRAQCEPCHGRQVSWRIYASGRARESKNRLAHRLREPPAAIRKRF